MKYTLNVPSRSVLSEYPTKDELRAATVNEPRYRGKPVKCFAPAGRGHQAIYAVVLKCRPDMVKVGRTTNWKQRRKTYDCWNFSSGDGIEEYRLFVVTDEYVALDRLEAAVLADMAHNFPVAHGREWFAAEFNDACRTIDRVMCAGGLSYVSG